MGKEKEGRECGKKEKGGRERQKMAGKKGKKVKEKEREKKGMRDGEREGEKGVR